MQYKTIALELLEQRPHMHEQLCQQRKLMDAMEATAAWLKNRHEGWKLRLSKAATPVDRVQIGSEAMELAVKDLEDSLPLESPAGEDEPFALDKAMAFLCNHTPHA